MRIGEAKNKDELLQALVETRERRLRLRQGYETIWWNNIALVAGDHYASWSPQIGRFEDKDLWSIEGDDRKPRFVVNHALSVARTELSKLTKNHPIMEVIANSDEPMDIAATKVGKAGLEYLEWKFMLRKKRKDALWWMIQCGLGALYVGWDYLNDKAGHYEFMIDPNTKEPVFNEDRKAILKKMHEDGEIEEPVTETYPLGEIDYKVYSPFQLLPDETSLDFLDIKDLITDEVADYDTVKGIYGKDADNLKPEEVTLGVMERRALVNAGLNAADLPKAENGVKIHTFWLLPGVYSGNKYLKNGIYFRWAQSRVVLDESQGGFPYQDGRMPFAFFQHIPSSVTIWPDSIINHIRGPNLELDKTWSQLIDNKDYMSNPMWLVAMQHKIKGKIKNVAGSIVRYVHVANVPEPRPVEGLQMPPQVEKIVDQLRVQILEIAGQSEVARGNVPTGVRSGVAVAYLQEEDDTKIAPTVEDMEMAIAYSSSLSLERLSQFYSVSRLLRYYRRDGQFDVIKFKGADLKNNTDTVAQMGSAMPKSKAAKQQYTLQLVELGIMTDPKKINEVLELGQGEPTDDEKSISQANRENNTMLHGLDQGMFHGLPKVDEQGAEAEAKYAAAVPVKKWHNHKIHLARHYSQMMEEEFDRLAISHPEIVRLFDEHTAMHEKLQAEAMQAQMAMVEATKGAPGGAPAGQQKNSPLGEMQTSYDVMQHQGNDAIKTHRTRTA